MTIKKTIEEKKKKIEGLRNNFQQLERQKQLLAQEILKLQGGVEALEEELKKNSKNE